MEDNTRDNQTLDKVTTTIETEPTSEKPEGSTQSIDSNKLSQEKLKAEDKPVVDDKIGDSIPANSSKLSKEVINTEDKLVIDDKTGDSTSINSNELSQEELKAARKKKAKRFLKYAIIAISGGLIQLTAYIILSDAIKLDKHVSFDAIYQKQPWLTEIFYDPDTGKTYGLSYFIAVSLSVIWNFTFNRKYTFKSASNVPKAMLLFVLYYAFSIPFNCWAIVQLNKLVVFPLSDKVILICIMLANGLPAFFYQRYVVFGRSLDTKHKKHKKEQGG